MAAVRAWDDPFEPRLFRGHVMHLRLRPRRHQFRYAVTALWIDADAPERAERRLFSVDRFNIVSFHRRDHGARDGSALRPWVETRLAEIGAPPPARIMCLSFPRLLGYAFNPLSVYYCYDADAKLSALVYEVKNTFGDQHGYAAKVARGAVEDFRAQALPKEFFVSPFIDMDKTYHFFAPAPGARLALKIDERDRNGSYLIATWNGAAEPLDASALARLGVSTPWRALKVIAAIHFEALRLWLKGVRFLGHPGAGKVVRRR